MRETLPDLKQLTDAEKDALIVELWEENQSLGKQLLEMAERLAKIEEKLNKPPKTSKNSSVPPSQTQKRNQTKGRPKGIRRQASVGREGGGRQLHPDPDQIVTAKVKACPHCAATIAESEQKLHAVYDKIEIPPIKPIVTRVNQYGGKCEHCQQEYVAPVPVGMEAGSPFGSSVRSLAMYYRYTHAISYERLMNMFGDVFGLDISEGALANLFESSKGQLDDHVRAILARLRRARLVGSDETSVRVNGKNQWEWVFQNQEVCLHVIRPSRGAAVIEEILSNHRPVIWVSDLYSSQKHHPAEQWQVCLAHQLRDCQYGIDAADKIFALRMKMVLLRAFVIHKKRDRLSASTLYQYRCDLNRRLEAILKLKPTNAIGIRLRKRYLKIKENLFLFLEDASIPPTNNQSERDLRMSKIFRKVTNGFRSDWGRDLFASVRSIVNTGKRHGLNAFQAISKALTSNSPDFLFGPG